MGKDDRVSASHVSRWEERTDPPDLITRAPVISDWMTKAYHRRWHRGHGRFYAIMNDPELSARDFNSPECPATFTKRRRCMYVAHESATGDAGAAFKEEAVEEPQTTFTLERCTRISRQHFRAPRNSMHRRSAQPPLQRDGDACCYAAGPKVLTGDCGVAFESECRLRFFYGFFLERATRTQKRGQAPLPDLFFSLRPPLKENKSGRGACPRCCVFCNPNLIVALMMDQRLLMLFSIEYSELTHARPALPRTAS